MKLFRRLACCGLPFLLSLTIMTGAAGTVLAAEPADLDMGATGSISLTLADSDGNAVSGGAVTLYKVAELYLDDGNMAYTLTSAFSGWTSDLDVTDTGLAAELEAYVKKNSISGTTVSVGKDGKISFNSLGLGLYLIVQTTEPENYKTIRPFVVTVPLEEDGVWVYEVDASPKVGAVTPIKPDTPPEKTRTTKPSTSTTSTTTTAMATILPQTGQLNWPIPVLAIAGLLLLVTGWCMNRSEKKRDRYAV